MEELGDTYISSRLQTSISAQLRPILIWKSSETHRHTIKGSKTCLYTICSAFPIRSNYQVVGGQHFFTSNSKAVRRFPERNQKKKKILANIDHEPRDIGNMRLSYDRDCEELIVKVMPKFWPEAAPSFFT